MGTKLLINMKLLTTLLLTLLTFVGYTQFCPALGPDQILPCGVGSTTLTADLSQCGPGGVNPNQTLFVDRISALRNWVEYVNGVLIQTPIVSEFNINHFKCLILSILRLKTRKISCI